MNQTSPWGCELECSSGVPLMALWAHPCDGTKAHVWTLGSSLRELEKSALPVSRHNHIVTSPMVLMAGEARNMSIKARLTTGVMTVVACTPTRMVKCLLVLLENYKQSAWRAGAR